MSAELAWSDAVLAARLFAVDPAGTGVLLRSRAGPIRDLWLAGMRDCLPQDTPVRRAPLHIGEGRLLGGLDLSATLLAGRPVAERGLLADADGGVMILAMAERIASSTTTYVTTAMDSREVVVERDGLSLRLAARFGVVALDEGLEDEFVPAPLSDRLAFHIALNDFAPADAEILDIASEDILVARERLNSLTIEQAQIDAICVAASALGIVSLRAPLLAIAVARAHATLEANSTITQGDIAVAARLVLAPRAMVLPQSDQPSEPDAPPPNDDRSESDQPESDVPLQDMDRALDEVILAAARAAIPPGVLAMLRDATQRRSSSRSSGKAGALQKSKLRGRPTGIMRGELKSGAKLSLIETLRAAAPWQPLRRAENENATIARPRVLVRKDDFRLARFKQRTETTTIFVVDASGSAALHRLAEAKGAVELLLADCYIRRDQVALISFRGTAAELLLPPTRSLARAKRSLAGLPGGGGTPLAAGLDAAFVLADSIRRKGQTPTIILLTDGRANIARDGTPGRPLAEKDSLEAARQLRGARVNSILVDTSPRPGATGEALAAEMGGRYLPLPHADAATLSKAVIATTKGGNFRSAV